MKTRPKIYVVVALFLCFAALVWAQTEYKWSEKLATLTVGSMNGDAMFMVLVDPNGTPASGLIGQTEALANWVGSTAVTTLGTIATGTWQATDVGVEYGGTGVSTLTDGGILLGSGTGAITALGVATNGQIPIGDGSTDPVLAAITGTANEVTVTNGAGTITLSLPNDAGTDISADLEEETHASEHQDTGGDEIAVTAGMMNTGTGASASTFWRGDNTWGTPAGVGDMTKAVYDVADDGFVDANDTAYAASWNANINAPSMNAVYDQMETKGAVAGQVWTGAHDFGGTTSVEIPNDESADATLTALGQLHIRGDEDRISAHLGAGGEIAGEATMSFLPRLTVTLDPGAWYDSSAYVNLGPILAKQYPNGIIIDYWEVTCHLNPDVEMDLDLCYSINSFDLADPNVVDVMDTTAGVSSEDTDANINAGAAIPAGVYLYLRFGADPEGTCVMLTATILYHGEED